MGDKHGKNSIVKKLPSPQELLKKILVKGKVNIVEEEKPEEESPKSSLSMPDVNKLTKQLKRFSSESEQQDLRTKKEKKTTPKILSDLFTLKGVSSKKMSSLTDELEYNQCYSFTNTKANGFIKPDLGLKLKTITNDKVIRVYPSPLRVTSSNYNPLPFWSTGIQMVALNFQTNGILYFNRCKYAAK
jgi:hypothetical protein